MKKTIETTEQIKAREIEAKWQALYFQIWCISCQTPREHWDQPSEAQFLRCREMTGWTFKTTDWPKIRDQIKRECPLVWETAINLCKSAL